MSQLRQHADFPIEARELHRLRYIKFSSFSATSCEVSRSRAFQTVPMPPSLPATAGQSDQRPVVTGCRTSGSRSREAILRELRAEGNPLGDRKMETLSSRRFPALGLCFLRRSLRCSLPCMLRVCKNHHRNCRSHVPIAVPEESPYLAPGIQQIDAGGTGDGRR